MISLKGEICIVNYIYFHIIGLDEQHRDNSGWTPLHYAAFEGHQVVCRTLLESGAKIDQTDNDGKPPLMLAAEEGHSDLVSEFLKNYGAPPDQKAHDGRTALRYYCLNNKICKLFLIFHVYL